ncbi:posterior protein-like [Hyperolius riggenbachi]|uniref:posterior protein-like n=1 Tax=Hyperolius riggenbachi TaxID=752182 RepID=UPI0035A33914
MEVVSEFLKKYSSANYRSCVDEALTHQYSDLEKQCEMQNERLQTKVSSKKNRKQRMANLIDMLIKMKELALQKELQFYTEKAQLREEIDSITKNCLAMDIKNNACECEELKEEVDKLVVENGDLQECLDDCDATCRLRELQIASLEQRESQKDNVIRMFTEQLAQKEQCLQLLKAQGNNACNQGNSSSYRSLGKEQRGREEHPICTADESQSPPELSLNQNSTLFTPIPDRIDHQHRNAQGQGHANHNVHSTTLSIQDRTNLCQILGKFDTSASPVSLSNKLEAVVTQYNLGNRDACALLRAWLPSQLCEKLLPPVGTHTGLLAELNSNWGNAADRMGELQRVMGGRDARGTNALENARFRKGEDPVLFCSEYLSLYKSTFNCPDMSPDDGSFLYSMANKCTFVDYHTKIALRNANSYQTFLNIIKDWIQETNQDSKVQRKIAEVAKSEGRVRSTGKCYKCGHMGHFMRDCKLNRRVGGNRSFSDRKDQKRPGPDRVQREKVQDPDVTLYGPLLKELERVKSKIAEIPEEYKTPPPSNPYVKP